MELCGGRFNRNSAGGIGLNASVQRGVAIKRRLALGGPLITLVALQQSRDDTETVPYLHQYFLEIGSLFIQHCSIVEDDISAILWCCVEKTTMVSSKRSLGLAILLGLMSTCAVAQSTVRRDDESADVRRLQEYLRSLDLLQKSPDGKFGPATEAAVIAFQRSHGMTADGVVGRATWEKLNAPKPQPQPQPGTTSERKLILTSTRMFGDDVKKLQELLRKHGETVDFDGTYGTGTVRAVKAFQSRRQLNPDGRVGPETWRLLKS